MMDGYRRVTLSIGIILIILSLSACCGKRMVNNMVTWGHLRVDESSEDKNTFKIFLNATTDCLCNYDGNKKDDRLRVMNILFEGKCKSIEILDENYVNLMLYNAWVTKMRCQQ